MFRAWKLQLAVILNKHRITGRFEKDDRGMINRQIQQTKIVFAQSRRSRQMALAERRTATTLAPNWQVHFETSRLEDLYCRRPNLRLVIPDERIIP